MADRTPTLADLRKYSVNRPGEAEVIRQTLYDTIVYPTAGATQIQFFALPIGQGLSAAPGNAGNAKTRADTNMELAGQLPNPKNALIESIEIDFQPGSSAAANTFALQNPVTFAVAAAVTVTSGIADVNAFYNTGFLILFIGSKEYLVEGPMGRFPPKVHREIDITTASNSATVGEIFVGLEKAVGRPYYLEPPVVLASTQNFNVTLNWPVAVATPSGFNGAVKVILDGYLFRNSQ